MSSVTDVIEDEEAWELLEYTEQDTTSLRVVDDGGGEVTVWMEWRVLPESIRARRAPQQTAGDVVVVMLSPEQSLGLCRWLMRQHGIEEVVSDADTTPVR